MPKEILFGSLVNSTAPVSSTVASRTLTFVYGPEHQRLRQDVILAAGQPSQLAAGAGTTWYLNGEDNLGLTYERFQSAATGQIENRHYLSAGGMVLALHTTKTSGSGGATAPTTSLRYMHHDHLGSIAAISNEVGQVVERLAYDPWGKRRYPTGLPDSQDQLVGINTERGYTLHEHLDEVGVIHMNGRIYDPLMGRFMSADPFIQAAYNLRSFNRYSYVWNNPLKMWDPTGYGAHEDSVSGAGYGSSNGSHDPTGVGGVADGRGGQVGGNAGGSGSASQSRRPPPASTVPVKPPPVVQEPVKQSWWSTLWSWVPGVSFGIDAKERWLQGDRFTASVLAFGAVSDVFVTAVTLGGGKVAVTFLREGVEHSVVTMTEKQFAEFAAKEATLFRAVSQAELKDIAMNGLRVTQGGYETGKLFATSLEDAAKFGKGNFKLDGIANYLVEVKVPQSVLDASHAFTADGMKAISIAADKLNVLKATLVNYSPWVK